jgi:DNA (cytosine-5)-methyltransferase 1
MSKLRLLSLFSGIGAFEKALTNLNVDYELVNFCEIDKYAEKAYCAVHGVSPELNLKDVRAIDTSKFHNIDLITYGFPCQDISSVGKQKGFTNTDGSLTRSGLFFEALRIIKELQPKYAIAENVKALTSKKFESEFEIVKSSLNEAGYNNYFQVLNAKDFNVPQNRERVFIVSIRKDIDNYNFNFPSGMVLTKSLKDIFDKEIDSKYFLTDLLKDFFITRSLEHERKGRGFRFVVTNGNSIARCLTTKSGGRIDDIFISKNAPVDPLKFDNSARKYFEDKDITNRYEHRK